MSIPAPRPGAAAFVTGASSGIGEALARDLAARGHDVVVVARRRDRLEKLAAELTAKHDVKVEILVCDLADADARTRMLAELDQLGLELDVVVLCAGFGMVGPFLEHDADRLTTQLRTNVESTIALARALTPAMAERRRGAVLFVSSMAGNQPMPNFAPYSASKAAVTSLGESLHCELKPDGVTVTVLAPSVVDTEWSGVAEATHQEAKQPKFMTANADQCSKAGLKALAKGKRIVVPLPQARAFAWMTQHMPRRIWLPACRKMLS
jgi:short-subunit dehydrogenase